MIALTHVPSPHLHAGERTHVPAIAINHHLAASQHAAYCEVLAACRAQVRTLDVNRDQPDGTFIEDTAVILDEVAVLASMGVRSRQPEVARLEPILRGYREPLRIEPPATLEGGDVLRIGRRLLVGQSGRTNAAGIEALAAIARKHGYTVEPIAVRGCLHLKTACTALPDGRLLVNPQWIDITALGRNYIPVPPKEPWAANIVLMSGAIISSATHPQTIALLSSLGHTVQTVDISEFAKAEGGVTCLSLLIP